MNDATKDVLEHATQLRREVDALRRDVKAGQAPDGLHMKTTLTNVLGALHTLRCDLAVIRHFKEVGRKKCTSD